MSPFKKLASRVSFCVRKTNASCCARTTKFSTISNEIPANSNTDFCAEKPVFVPFDDVLKQRRSEASRSVVIQVKNEQSYGKLYNYISRYGLIKNSFFYSLGANFNFILIEFKTQESLEVTLKEGQFLKKSDVKDQYSNSEIFPVRSPFLWFRLDTRSSDEAASITNLQREPNTDLPANKIQSILNKSKSFSDDMVALYNAVKLNELGSRLRFVSAHQVETAFKGLFPHCSVLPFGSSINGFGKISCDLDLVLTYDNRLKHEIVPNRLIYHSKASTGSTQIQNQRHLEIVADILQYFLPGCVQVKRILRARVPILRYKQDITGIDCDLSSTNMSGVYMSEMLYMFGSYDWRVCPLVFTIRYWAKEIGLTNPAPGRWITNFSLTLLVLFYLQYKKMIPTLKTLVDHKRKEDTRSFDGIDCSFLRDLNLLPKSFTNKNDISLAELLHEFFEFYSTFDFGSYAISLNTGTIIPKPEYSALYIVNPLEKHLNVSKNVSPDECGRIKTQLETAAWNMEHGLGEERDGKKWGLLDLVNSHILHKNIPIRRQGSMKPISKINYDEFFEKDDETINWKASRSNSKKQPS